MKPASLNYKGKRKAYHCSTKSDYVGSITTWNANRV